MRRLWTRFTGYWSRSMTITWTLRFGSPANAKAASAVDATRREPGSFGFAASCLVRPEPTSTTSFFLLLRACAAATFAVFTI